MAFDKLPPDYAGDDRTLREVLEYLNYLREQTAHEIEVLKQKSSET